MDTEGLNEPAQAEDPRGVAPNSEVSDELKRNKEKAKRIISNMNQIFGNSQQQDIDRLDSSSMGECLEIIEKKCRAFYLKTEEELERLERERAELVAKDKSNELAQVYELILYINLYE
jgi:hypothetical protein